MGKSYSAYKKADRDKAIEIFEGNFDKRAEIFREGNTYRIAVSAFKEEKRGMMRYYIPPEVLSEISSDVDVFSKLRDIKNDRKMYFRVGSFEKPCYYNRIKSNEPNDIGDSYRFLLFRDGEKLPEGIDIQDYILRSRSLMKNLADESVKLAKAYAMREDQNNGWRSFSTKSLYFVYTLEKNTDGSLLSLDTPVDAPASEYDRKRIEEKFGIVPENGKYTIGFRFTPVFGMDYATRPLQRFLNAEITLQNLRNSNNCLLSTPYVFNIRNSDSSVRHDVIIDPMSALEIVDRSKSFESSKNNLVTKGVFVGSLIEYNRSPSPLLMDDTYLYEKDEVDALYKNESGVSRMFRHPVFNRDNSKILEMKDIEQKESAPSGRIRNIYVPDKAFADWGWHDVDRFNLKNHNHYTSLMTLIGYRLKNDGVDNVNRLGANNDLENNADVENDFMF